MSQTQPWFRYYTETPDDPKLKRVAGQVGCERILVNGIWAAVMAMAKTSPIEGSLLIAKDVPATTFEIADLAGTANLDLVEKILTAFQKLDMLQRHPDGYLTLPHWHERQFISDNSTPRVQQHRRNKRGNVSPSGNGNVTPSLSGNGPETETEQNRAETEGSAPQFDEVRRWIEQITGMLPDQGAVVAINELIQMGATYDDIQAGYNWLRGQGRTVRYYNALVGPTRTSLSKRQADAKPATNTEIYYDADGNEVRR